MLVSKCSERSTFAEKVRATTSTYALERRPSVPCLFYNKNAFANEVTVALAICSGSKPGFDTEQTDLRNSYGLKSSTMVHLKVE